MGAGGRLALGSLRRQPQVHLARWLEPFALVDRAAGVGGVERHARQSEASRVGNGRADDAARVAATAGVGLRVHRHEVGLEASRIAGARVDALNPKATRSERAPGPILDDPGDDRAVAQSRADPAPVERVVLGERRRSANPHLLPHGATVAHEERRVGRGGNTQRSRF